MATKAKGKSKGKSDGKSKKKSPSAATSTSKNKESVIIPKETLQKIIPLKNDLHIEDLDEDVLKERSLFIT